MTSSTYQLQGAIELLVSINVFCEVSTNGEPPPTTDYLRMQEEWSFHLAGKMPEATMIFLGKDVCRQTQRMLDDGTKEGTCPDMELGIGHIPLYIGFERAIIMPDGTPLHTLAVADGRLAAIGRSGTGNKAPSDHDPYIEYWHWKEGLTISQAADAVKMPARNMLPQAITAMIVAAQLGEFDLGRMDVDHRDEADLRQLVQRVTSKTTGLRIKSETLFVPAGGLYILKYPVPISWDGQWKGKLN